MPVKSWSDNIYIAELYDEPHLSEDLQALRDRFHDSPADVVLNLAEVTQMNSSNLAELLRIRAEVIKADHHLRLCCLNDSVWSILLTTALDQIFHFSEDVASALTALQIGNDAEAE